MTYIILFSLLFVLFGSWFIFKVAPKEEGFSVPNLMIILIVLVFIIKLPMAYFMQGFPFDMGLFKAWGALCNDVGFNNVYFQDEVYLDYPPAYLYVLSLLDHVKNLLGWGSDENLHSMLIKIPSLIADSFIAYTIYKTAKRKFYETHSVYLGLLYLLNPLSLINGSVWGQIDSIWFIVLLYALIKLNQNKFIYSGILCGVGVALKPQFLIFVPIFFFYTVYRAKIKGLIIGVLSGITTIFLLAIPFTQSPDFTWLVNRYASTIDYYNYYTVNAFNFHALLALNWTPLPESGIFSVFLSVAPILLAVGLCGVYMYFQRQRHSTFIAAALLMSTVFMFATKMHERYLFPAVFLVFFAFILNKDKRFFYTYLAFSTANFLNVAVVLYLSGSFHSQYNEYIIVISIVNLLSYAYFVFVCFFGHIHGEKKIVVKKRNPIEIPHIPIDNDSVDRKIRARDVIAVSVISLTYAVFAFWNLGSNEMVLSAWTPTQDESVVYEIKGDSLTFMYLSGLDKNEYGNTVIGSDFTVDFSNDGVTFEEEMSLKDSYVFTWNEKTLTQFYKYVRITANTQNNILNEIAFRAVNGEGLVVVEAVEAVAPQLTDEQRLVPVFPSYMDGAYFDEIYHARTAYEHILGVEPYENTHPPLGKLIMSFFISIFGMNPFGWRFAGALFGVLMLPIFYFIVKRLFGSAVLSCCATLLFAFDFMHFTQTRIATIDTYAVFFILLMYAAMLVFIQKDIVESSFISLAVPLGFCGVFMGLGISAKWTCAYAALGLAVLFFGKLIVSYKRSFVKKITMTRILDLCLFCIAFFIFIPFLIYFASFLPILLLPHNADDLFGNFFRYQNHMLNYHSTLVAEHSFESPWYEWPFAIKNMWYYVSYNYMGTGSILTISCLGNPLLWWSSLASIIFVCVEYVKKRSVECAVVLAGFLSVYLPWTLVPRLTFVYHYFTAVPFIIIALIYVVNYFNRQGVLAKTIIDIGGMVNFVFSKTPLNVNCQTKITASKLCLIIFTVVNIGLFALFYPVISGSPISEEYLSFLKWMPEWYLG